MGYGVWGMGWGMGYGVWGGAPRRSGYGYGRLAVVPEARGMGYDQILAGRTARGMGYTTSLYPCSWPIVTPGAITYARSEGTKLKTLTYPHCLGLPPPRGERAPPPTLPLPTHQHTHAHHTQTYAES